MSLQQVDSDQTLDAFPLLSVPISTTGHQTLHTQMDTNHPVTFATMHNTSGQYVNPIRPQSLQTPMDTNPPITVGRTRNVGGASVPMDIAIGGKRSLQTYMDTHNPTVIVASTRNTSGTNVLIDTNRQQTAQVPMDTNEPVTVAHACVGRPPSRWMTKRQWGIMPRGVLLMCSKCLAAFKEDPPTREDNTQVMHISVCMDCVRRNKSCRFA